MPALVAMVALLAIYSQTLSGSAEAMAFYFSFDLALFLDPQTWRMSAGQAFFSLGVGTGVLITYGSYIPRNVNILTSAAAVAATNSVISLTVGVAVFSYHIHFWNRAGHRQSAFLYGVSPGFQRTAERQDLGSVLLRIPVCRGIQLVLQPEGHELQVG